jgi:hypothetical protein
VRRFGFIIAALLLCLLAYQELSSTAPKVVVDIYRDTHIGFAANWRCDDKRLVRDLEIEREKFSKLKWSMRLKYGWFEVYQLERRSGRLYRTMMLLPCTGKGGLARIRRNLAVLESWVQ